MTDYSRVLSAIDEELIDIFHMDPNWNSDAFVLRRESFLNCLRKYMEEHPDRKEKVKKILSNDDCYCLSNTRAGHVELYVLPLFHDTETLLHILENRYSYQERNILEYEPEQKVLDIIFERYPDLLVDYLKTHMEKKEEYKARVPAYLCKGNKSRINGNEIFKIYSDKESCLAFLNDDRFDVDACGLNVIYCNQEQEVIAKVFEKSPSLVIDFLKKYPEKKEEYESQALKFFYEMREGKLDSDFHYKLSDFFDIYEADTDLWLEILNKSKFDAELCEQILRVCNDAAVIDKILDLLSKQDDNEKTISVYDDIVCKVPTEDICKRILGQTDNKRIVNLMTAISEDFSSEFQEELLHHPKLSYKGWLDLREYMPESAFGDEDIYRILQNFDVTEYNSSYAATTINKFFECILEIRPTAEMARKVFDCCTKIPNYGKNYFSYGGQEAGILFKAAKIDSSEEMFKRLFDYIVSSGCTHLFGKLLEQRPTAEVLEKIDAYYQAHYKEKAKIKAQMKKITPFYEEPAPSAEDEEPVRPRRRRRRAIGEEDDREIEKTPNSTAQANKEVLNTLKALMDFDYSKVQFAKQDFHWAAFYCNEKKILDMWKYYRIPEIDAFIENYLQEEYGHMSNFEATPEFYEEKIKSYLNFIGDSELKEKLQRGEAVEIQVLGEKELFDYVGYYESMVGMWGTVIKNTDDLKLLDKVVEKNVKTQTKALRSAAQKKSSYDRDNAKGNIETARMELEKECRKKGYIRKKLKQLCPRLSFEKAVAKMFERMETTTNKREKAAIKAIMMAEGFDFYVDYIKNSEGKIDERIRDYVLKEKEKMIFKLPENNEHDRESVYEEAQMIEEIFREKNIIEATLKEKYPDLKFEEALIKEAARVVRSGDAKEKERFNNFLLAEGEERLLNVIDRDVCDYLFHNFTAQNLEEVNALRSFYGLKIIVDESPFETPNLRTVRRMQFEDSVSQPEPWSDYYAVQHSEIYRSFVPDRRRKFKESDYYNMLDQSEAIQVLREHGYASFINVLPNALAQAKVPPEIAVQFNVKDLQAVFYEQLPDEEKDVYKWNGEFLFTRSWIEIVGEYDEDGLMGARQSYWMDMVNNKQLVRLMSDDFRRHNIGERDIKRLFRCAEDEGYPNAGRKWEKVTSVKLPLHHVLALKDKGLNYPNNYAPVVIYEGGLNSHDPLHWHDTPLDILYKVEGEVKPTEIMLSTEPRSEGAKQVHLRTVFVDDENDRGVKVLFYGGARKCSRYVGRLHDMENIALKAKALGKEQMEADAKMKALVEIVFKNVEQTVEKANERIEMRRVQKSRKIIEKSRRQYKQGRVATRKVKSNQKGD